MGTADSVVLLEPWNNGKLVGQKAPFKLKDSLSHKLRTRPCAALKSTVPARRSTQHTPRTAVTYRPSCRLPAYFLSCSRNAFDRAFAAADSRATEDS
jgi:hypothetical protein